MSCSTHRWLVLCSVVSTALGCAVDSSGNASPDAEAAGDSGRAQGGGDSGAQGTPDSGVNGGGDSGVAGGGDAGGTCTNLTVFADTDMDTYGASSSTMDVCLLPGEEVAGYSRQAGDCKPADPWAHPNAPEICNDNVDDDCDSADAPCPTTQTAGIDIPSWDCVSGDPPANVYAFAVFGESNSYYQPNGCFVFFEGLADEFYVQRVNLNRVNTAANCTQIDGCVCPSLQGWPSYDRRLYAFTTAGEVSACPEIRVIDHGGEMQAVSNDCRKYLYQLHYYDIPYSFIAGSVDSLERRLSLFPTVEIACASEQYPQLPYVTLLTAPIEHNQGFVKK